ncbi:PP2C family protein-serine/threonine phosphatase [Sphaerimonospora cavernae]|uniref:PP2C family protein-serine/threonine phosphatase n=1 Tax=Sphaerimonospora cavernae TaxID=1740611 RepID=A0ABV6TXE8_9ACTN
MDTRETMMLSAGERVLADLLSAARVSWPDRLADLVMDHGGPLGVRDAVIYLSDLQELVLVPLPATGTKTGGPLQGAGKDGRHRGVTRIEGTVPGLAYRELTVVTSEEDCDATYTAGLDSARRGCKVWLPLLDANVRLGVLELSLEHLDEHVLQRCQMLADVVALLVVNNGTYSDTFARTRRREPMQLRAEMVWAFMPGNTFVTKDVAISAALESAYQVGGDAYDLSSTGETVHVAVFDATGHDLVAGLVAAVGLAASRNTRRAGGTLADIATLTDSAIIEQNFEERFMTGLLINLDAATGHLEWVNCGHPPPLLIRKGKIKELARVPERPMGLLEGTSPQIHHEHLQPGDRVLCYTDGVTEARMSDGQLFGLDRLVDTIIRTAVAGMSTAEALRRLIHGLISEQGRLTDDATVTVLEWRPDNPGALIRPTLQALPKTRPTLGHTGGQ